MTRSDDAKGTTVTLIVHGTFAAADGWWRLGDGTRETFADRLETALVRQGLEGTVWAPALRQGLGYDDFSWSGHNHHGARRAGARKLAASINALATKLKATREQPLTVNFVAHSHGGNVVLEAVRHLRDEVSIGRCVMLGTPLISFHPAFRLCRLAVANLLFVFIFMFALLLVVQIAHLGVTCTAELFGGDYECSFFESEPDEGSDPELSEQETSGAQLTLSLLPMLIFFGWVFWVIALVGDIAWYILFKPILWMFGRWAGQTYGPAPSVLADRLGSDDRGQKRIVLFTSHFDEAELLLQLGATPNQLYLDYLNSRWHAIFRFVERLTLRPIVAGIYLKMVETVLEHYVFGFPWRMVFCFDYAIANDESSRAYPHRLFERVHLADDSLSSVASGESRRIQESAAAEAIGTLPMPLEQQAPTLYASLRVIAADIRAQIKLRHSRYYQSLEVVERVAEALNGAAGRGAGQALSG